MRPIFTKTDPTLPPPPPPPAAYNSSPSHHDKALGEYKLQQAGGQEAEVVVFFGTLMEYAYVDNKLYGFFVKNAVILDAWIHNLYN